MMRASSMSARLLLAAASAVTVAAAYATSAPTAGAVPIGPGCPVLYVLGVQGTGQSSPAADPLADTGLVGALIGPVIHAVPHLVQRSYIAYSAGFGGAVPGGGTEPYAVSVAEARAGLDVAATEIVTRCPATFIAVVGYSQGAQAASGFARDVGAGTGPVNPDRVAGIALYSNPDRVTGGPVIPGRPGQAVPDPAPGTSGAAVSTVQLPLPSAFGGGIAGGEAVYGALTGRVADICTTGDLACSAPDRAALLRVAAEIAAQADLRDPVAAITSMGALLTTSLGEAWTTVVLNDFVVSAGNVDYVPQAGLAARLIAAADPRTPTPTPDQVAAATGRWNEITAAAAANPLALLPKLIGQLSAAWAQLVTDNADLVNPAIWLRYADTVARHNGYASSGQLASGTAWMVALAHDIAGRR